MIKTKKYKQIALSIQERMLEIIFGWKSLPMMPKERCVVVFSHTSYWDFLIWIMALKKNAYLLTNPNYYNWTTKWFYNVFNLIPSSRIENKEGGNLVDCLVKRFRRNDSSLILSPKGTVKKKEWKTGYYHIARGLGVKIYPLILDFEKREGWFGNPCDPSASPEPWCQDFLKSQFKQGVEFNLDNVEYVRDYNIITQNPYERCFPFDFCLISLLAFVPHILILLKHRYWFSGGLGIVALINSLIYHYRREGAETPVIYIRPLEIGSVYVAFLTILLQALPHYKKISYSCYFSLLLGYAFLRCGYNRGHREKRGKYAIYHSFYHLLAALGMIQLTESFVYS